MRLTWPEICLAAEVALMRAINNLRRKRKNRNGDTGTLGLDYHFLGCLGEIALAKHTGLYWSGNVGNFDAPDVGPYQVRACGQPDHCMMMHDWDKDEAPFVNALAVRDGLPAVVLRGWVLGREGKLRQFWRDYARPAFFVPADQLHPMQELPPCEETERVARVAQAHATSMAI